MDATYQLITTDTLALVYFGAKIADLPNGDVEMIRCGMIERNGTLRWHDPEFITVRRRDIAEASDICPVTLRVECADRDCELHYMNAPLRLKP